MSRSWSGRLTRRPQDQAAQAAQDGAVAAFLDLDNRQSYVKDAMDAVGENSASGAALTREWTTVAQVAFDASSKYLATAESHSLLDSADRPTGVDPVAAAAAFTQVHKTLADAAIAVDTFYRKHADELEKARSLRAATPQISSEARAAAVQAEADLTKAEADGFAYPSVMDAAGELVNALSELKTAETVGSPLEIRHAAAAVHAAAETVGSRITAARNLAATVRGSLSSVKTRIEAVGTRLESLPSTRSALLREFSAACSRDLSGADDRARRALEDARGEFAQAQSALNAGQPEPAANHLATARAKLSTAEAEGDSMGDRLRLLRSTQADPAAAAKATRFKLRDAQLLVVSRGLVPQWGSVLDAQSDRIERAAADLTGTHPDYWTYLQTLQSVDAFVKNVIDRVRGEAAHGH
ncbi:hypothetical protein SAMN04515671_1545 [Nakamurella panacisegetis]|uniref:Uncharacterized protein n=1 Tax=Nakamurella panacisegetis TaxID=1090615 RepID=A0A1H0L5S4_9ACTN|nr:hypothetical protein [Nakamurella panacisegetis]SDO63432.1 hypothetical protein SAMN04515671_1545 [Nakamurella panacisegetis]